MPAKRGHRSRVRLHKAVCIWADEFWRGIAAGAGDMRFVADSKDAVQEG
eukprot:CAMPEP_0174366042 /NCGR_PEP_ID=MMETSP0811_2-20130205/79647_1 /TAXON_ID=73025 ORGANISM="Eutreptiella gymnastica-like, Strain CCMP1594" /NCGR_SAMPLE_ID=MMETSP0811_2 /ASSEMBLY_ACC=CAM_ASM_000667 /LENGTH=48 /DNA_ID= /DNA_START= /DNA_END= /DNA_ORIENTATION=